LRAQLAALGAPLHHEAVEPSRGPVEETVVRGVHLAHRDPDVARTLPVCLYRQRSTLDPERLREHAARLGACPSNAENGHVLEELSHFDAVFDLPGGFSQTQAVHERACVPTSLTSIDYSDRLLGEKQALGFFLDLTAELSGDRRFAEWMKPLRDRRYRTSRDFFHSASRSRRQLQLAEEKTPEAGRRWQLRMNMDLDAFRSTFEKFVSHAGA
jgi:hypothetical protein